MATKSSFDYPVFASAGISSLLAESVDTHRYDALGKGQILTRLLYAASRALATPGYHGQLGWNGSALVGRGISQGISVPYSPPQARTAGELASKFAYTIGRDALANMFREVWPDIAARFLHRQP